MYKLFVFGFHSVKCNYKYRKFEAIFKWLPNKTEAVQSK